MEARLWAARGGPEDQLARDRLFMIYKSHAELIARRLFADRRSGDIEFADLRQLAYAGLLEAMDRYDPDRGIGFKFYAGRRIRGSVLDGLAKISERREQLSWRQRVRRERTRSLAPANVDGLSAPAALDALIELAVGLAVGFMLEDGVGLFAADQAASAQPSPYETTAWREALRRVLTEMGSLPERQQDILRRHYFDGMTFEDIGRLWGVTKGRISQLHADAIHRLRHSLEARTRLRLES